MSVRNIALIISICLGTFMTTLDISIVNVALPAIQQALQVSMSGLQWIVDSYAICLSALILTSGSLGDKFGRKRVWMCGVLLFTLSSAICAFAGSINLLLTGRVIQGVAGAAVIPGALSLLTHAFTEQSQRTKAIGIWSTVSALSLIAGPTLGGTLVHITGWNSIFWINIPIGVIALLLGVWGIKESSVPGEAALDPTGQLLSILCLAALTWGLIVAGSSGWHNLLSRLSLLIALILFCLFIRVETKVKRPLLPCSLFRKMDFTMFNCASFVLGFSSYSSVFFISLFLQQVQGWSAGVTGWAMSPEFIAMALASMVFSRLVNYFGINVLMIAGYALIGVALLLMIQLHYNSNYIITSGYLILLGLGSGLAVPATSALIMQSVESQRSGMASSVMNALRQTGMTLGIALLGSLMNMRAVKFAITTLQTQGLSDTEQIARTLVIEQKHSIVNELTAERLQEIKYIALASGFNEAMLWSGLLSLIMSAVLIFYFRYAVKP